MKRISWLVLGFALLTGPLLRAQDAATEERFNKLAGQIQDLQAGQEAIGKRFDALGKEIDSLRGQVDKPTGNYASEEDLKRLTEAMQRRLTQLERETNHPTLVSIRLLIEEYAELVATLTRY